MENVFTKGKAIFESKPWWKGFNDGEPATQCTCLVLALSVERSLSQEWCRVTNDGGFEILYEAIREIAPDFERRYPERPWSVQDCFDFNDSPRTTREQILAVYDKAAKLLDRKVRLNAK